MRRLLTLLGVLSICALPACREHPTAPGATGAPEPPAAPLSPALAGFALAIEDLRSRILPSLGEAGALTNLGTALGELEAALVEANVVSFETALQRADAAAAQIQVEPAGWADFSVVLLVLEQIAATRRAELCATATAEDVPESTAAACEPRDPVEEP